MSEETDLAQAIRASLRDGNIDEYEAEALEEERQYRTRESTTNDEEIARELQRQLNESANLPIASSPSQENLLRQKTYSGAYHGKDRGAKPCFTYTMMGICLLFMIFELVANNNLEEEYFEDFTLNPLFGPSIDTLVFMGAKRADLIVEEGDFWRLFMPILLHGGLLHLLFNMLFLYSFGTGLENEFGHARVAFIFFVSGFFGILMSAIFIPITVSVGASGACYGLIGAAWADFWLNFGFYKQGNWKGWLAQLTFGTVLNLALGLIPTLDNFTHIGGFIAGFFAGLTVLTLPRFDIFQEVKPDKGYQIILKTCSILMIPLAFVIGLAVLYTGIDVNAYCPWCTYLSCVPTPWWLCDISCSEGFQITVQPEGSALIACPRNAVVVVEAPIPNLDTEDARLEFCELHCL